MTNDVHSVPGRVRVKIPALRSKANGQEEMAGLFSTLEGIEAITVNPVTGSLVVNYDPGRLDSRKILKLLRGKGYLGKSSLRRPEKGQRSLPKTREAMGRALFGWAMGNLLEGTGLGFLAVLI